MMMIEKIAGRKTTIINLIKEYAGKTVSELPAVRKKMLALAGGAAAATGTAGLGAGYYLGKRSKGKKRGGKK